MSNEEVYFINFTILILGLSTDIKIDERKSDIYFANGVLTTRHNAKLSLDLIWKKTLAEQCDNDVTKIEKELNFDTAYNQTFGFAGDFHESYLQLAD